MYKSKYLTKSVLLELNPINYPFLEDWSIEKNAKLLNASSLNNNLPILSILEITTHTNKYELDK